MKKPVIGVISRPSSVYNLHINAVEESYRNAILKSGGVPVLILPPQQILYEENKPCNTPKLTLEEKQILIRELEVCDGILEPGGYKSYEYDYFISDYAKDINMPFLGICLGMQIMARSGGSAVIVKNDSCVIHYTEDKYAHDIIINKNSLLYKILLKEQIKVNSYHNYHIESVKNFYVSAMGVDSVIEAIEDKDALFRVGVQWHPEKDLEDENNRKIFESFIDAAKDYSKKK